MTTRRPSVVRFAASALLTTVFTLGAHTFVPTAFAGATGNGNCRSVATQSENEAPKTFLDQVRYVIATFDFFLP